LAAQRIIQPLFYKTKKIDKSFIFVKIFSNLLRNQKKPAKYLNNVNQIANANTGDFMLIIYLFLILVTFFVYELINRIVHICYLVKISILVDNIGCINDLLYLRLKDFEYAIAEVFRRKGHKVQMADHFGEGGNGIILDEIYYVIVRKDSLHSLVEIEQAKKLAKHMRDNNIHRGMIITLGDFKTNTRRFCHTNVIKCINGDELFRMFKSVQGLSPQSVYSK